MKKKIQVAVIGEPNAGKSTMVNAFIGKNICMVSSKPHTTRKACMAVVKTNNTQIVFLDTPGIGRSRKKYESSLYKCAIKTLGSSDLSLFLFDSTKKIPLHIIHLANNTPQKIAVFNKTDLANKGKLLPMIEEIKNTFEEIYFISSIKGDGLVKIKESLENHSTEGLWDFDDNFLSSNSLEVIIEEKTQEVIFEKFHREVPYNVKVQNTDIVIKKNEYFIYQNILVDKHYKHMFLGKNILKQIGILSRKKLSDFLKKTTHLFLNIKIHK